MKMIDGELYPEESDSTIKEFNNKKKTNNIPISLKKEAGSIVYDKYAIKYEAKRKFMDAKIIEAILDEIDSKILTNDNNRFLANPKNVIIEIPVQRIIIYFGTHDYYTKSRFGNAHNLNENAELMPDDDVEVYKYVYDNFKDLKKTLKNQGIYIYKRFQNKYYIQEHGCVTVKNKDEDLLIECRLVPLHPLFSLKPVNGDYTNIAVLIIAISIFLFIILLITMIIECQ